MKTIEQQYKKLSDLEHVLLRPGMYIGDLREIEEYPHVLNNGKFVKEKVIYCPAFQKIFDEILSNSIDESKRNKKLDKIKVIIDEKKNEITIWDNGGIPVVKHKEHDQWIPEMIFSELKAGSNFDDTEARTVAGSHGMGVTLSSIFSKEFHIKTCDGKNQFEQTYTDNLKNMSEPKIKERVAEPFTQIVFIPDFQRLGTSLSSGNIKKLIKRVYDAAACNPNISFWLNNEKLNIKSFKDYIALYKEEFIYEEVKGLQIGFCSSSGSLEHVSFVNSTETKIGGAHVDLIINPVVEAIRTALQKKHKVEIYPSEIKNHFCLFVNAVVINPKFSSQTKEQLIAGQLPEWKVTDKLINKLINSEICQSILDWIAAKEEAKRLAELRKLNKNVSGTNVRKIVKLSDATETVDRTKCILMITEGLSASLSTKSARDPKIIGSYPLKGKPLNVNGVEPKKLMDNDEFKDILSSVGLEIGKKVNSVKDLRYGKIAFAADADRDGSHIVGLLINMFYTYWPEMFDLKMICRFITPIVKVTVGKQILSFFNLEDFENWKNKNQNVKYNAKYYKGLGTHTTDQYREYLKDLPTHLIPLEIPDKKQSEYIDLAFNKSRADDRKKWLELT